MERWDDLRFSWPSHPGDADAAATALGVSQRAVSRRISGLPEGGGDLRTSGERRGWAALNGPHPEP
jgi:hypothetical protein